MFNVAKFIGFSQLWQSGAQDLAGDIHEAMMAIVANLEKPDDPDVAARADRAIEGSTCALQSLCIVHEGILAALGLQPFLGDIVSEWDRHPPRMREFSKAAKAAAAGEPAPADQPNPKMAEIEAKLELLKAQIAAREAQDHQATAAMSQKDYDRWESHLASEARRLRRERGAKAATGEPIPANAHHIVLGLGRSLTIAPVEGGGARLILSGDFDKPCELQPNVVAELEKILSQTLAAPVG